MFSLQDRQRASSPSGTACKTRTKPPNLPAPVRRKAALSSSRPERYQQEAEHDEVKKRTNLATARAEYGLRAVGCCAHVRRKFDEAIKAQGLLGPEKRKASLAGAAMAKIQQLYRIERETKSLSPEER
jgi:hypothetical protein